MQMFRKRVDLDADLMEEITCAVALFLNGVEGAHARSNV